MRMRASDMERVCAVAFDRWCAEALVDPRLRDILEEAFINGFIARDCVEIAGHDLEVAANGVGR